MTEDVGIRYATTADGYHIAYKTWGQGDLLHVFLPEFGASVDSLGQHPAHIRFERFLGSLSRCVCFDPRGIGASDPAPPDRVGHLEDWAIDLAAVLDEVGAERFVFTGEGYSAQAAIWFAVTYPDRILRLLLANPYARLLTADDYPAGSYSTADVDAMAAAVVRDWGTGLVHAQFSPALVLGSILPGSLRAYRAPSRESQRRSDDGPSDGKVRRTGASSEGLLFHTCALHRRPRGM